MLNVIHNKKSLSKIYWDTIFNQFGRSYKLGTTLCWQDCGETWNFTHWWWEFKLMSLESVMPSNLCHPPLLPPSIFPSIRVFSNESALRIGWPKYWSFSFSVSPSNEYSRLLPFRMDWLDLLGVQGTLKSLLQHHSSKASILQQSVLHCNTLWF